MKIVFKPLKGRSNTYTEDLAAGLNKIENISVVPFTFIGIIKSDIVHIHWPDMVLKSRSRILKIVKIHKALTFFLIIRVLRKKIIWTVHNPIPKFSSGIDYIDRAYYRFLGGCFDGYIFLSNLALRQFEQKWGLPRKPFKVIELVSNNRIAFLEPKEIDDFGLSNYALLLGRIDLDKNVISTVREMRRVNNSLRIVVAGPSVNQNLVEQLEGMALVDPMLEVRAHLHPLAEVAYLLTHASVVVVNYPTANSNVVIDAIALGKPLVVSDNEILGEIIDRFDFSPVVTFDTWIKDECSDLGTGERAFIDDESINSMLKKHKEFYEALGDS